MDALIEGIKQLIGLAGQLWLYALIALIVVMVCESAKPKPEEGEKKPRAGVLGVVGGVASFVTPFLLFVHAYMEAARTFMPGALLSAIIVLGGAVMISAIIGWIIAAAMKPLGRIMGAVAPFLAIAVFAFAVYVTRANVIQAFNIYVLHEAAVVETY